MEITNHFQPKVVCDLSQVWVGIGDKPREFFFKMRSPKTLNVFLNGWEMALQTVF